MARRGGQVVFILASLTGGGALLIAQGCKEHVNPAAVATGQAALIACRAARNA